MKPLLLLLLLGPAGCLATDAADRPAPRSQFSKHAVIQGSCAPWDGPAVELHLSPSPLECMRESFPCVVISIWKGLEDVSGKSFTFPDPDNRVGAAVFAQSAETYGRVRSGMVRFEPFKPGSPARGEFDVELPDGRRERGTFEAPWCAERVPCG